MMEEGRRSLDEVVDDAIVEIISHVRDYKDVIRCGMVNQRWHRLHLWVNRISFFFNVESQEEAEEVDLKICAMLHNIRKGGGKLAEVHVNIGEKVSWDHSSSWLQQVRDTIQNLTMWTTYSKDRFVDAQLLFNIACCKKLSNLRVSGSQLNYAPVNFRTSRLSKCAILTTDWEAVNLIIKECQHLVQLSALMDRDYARGPLLIKSNSLRIVALRIRCEALDDDREVIKVDAPNLLYLRIITYPCKITFVSANKLRELVLDHFNHIQFLQGSLLLNLYKLSCSMKDLSSIAKFARGIQVLTLDAFVSRCPISVLKLFPWLKELNLKKGSVEDITKGLREANIDQLPQQKLKVTLKETTADNVDAYVELVKKILEIQNWEVTVACRGLVDGNGKFCEKSYPLLQLHASNAGKLKLDMKSK